MSVTVKAGTPAADAKRINDALDRIRKLLKANAPKIPQAKLDLLQRLLDPPVPPVAPVPPTFEVEPEAGLTDADGKALDGSTTPPQGATPGKIKIDNTLRPPRLDAVLLHELVHATEEGELDAEVIENLFYPPVGGAGGGGNGGGGNGGGGNGGGGNGGGQGGGATPPTEDDTGSTDKDGKHKPGAFGPPGEDGLVWDHTYVWDPKTGEVWEVVPDERDPTKKKKGKSVFPPTGPMDEPRSPWRPRHAEPLPGGKVLFGDRIFVPTRLSVHRRTLRGTLGQRIPTDPRRVIEMFQWVVKAWPDWARENGFGDDVYVDYAEPPTGKRRPPVEPE